MAWEGATMLCIRSLEYHPNYHPNTLLKIWRREAAMLMTGYRQRDVGNDV